MTDRGAHREPSGLEDLVVFPAAQRHALELAVARILADADSVAEATPRLLRDMGTALECAFAAIWRVDETGSILTCAGTWQPEGAAPGFESVTRQITLPRGTGIPGRVLEEGRPAWLPDIAGDATLPRGLIAARENLHAAMAFPILFGGEVLGVVEFFISERREPDHELLAVMSAIGTQVGQFFGRKEAEEEIRRSEARTRAMLESALDSIISMDAQGQILEWNPAAERTFGLSREDVIGRAMVDVIIPEHLRDGHRRGVARYLKTGEPRVLDQRVELEGRRADGTLFPVELTVTRVPLPGPPVFTAYLRDITRRRTNEEERESLLSREREARAEVEVAFATLQQSLLPPQLPEIAGVDLAAWYRAAGRGSQVGGDFYDVFPLTRSRWGLAIGDVSGRGVAAASLAALARYAIRAAATQSPRPSRVLTALNRVVRAEAGDGRFCTAIAARLQPERDGVRVDLASGGHPPPLIRRSDGAVEVVDVGGVLLGVLPDVSTPDARVHLGPGDSILFYTDGAIEFRTPTGMLGTEGLAALLATTRADRAEEVIHDVVAASERLRESAPQDDMALLLLRVR